MDLLPIPIVNQPLFEGQQWVLVESLQAGSTISLWSGPELLHQLVCVSGAAGMPSDRPFAAGEVISASAAKLGMPDTSRSEERRVQPLPTPLPPPAFKAGPTLVSGAECISAGGCAPSATVSAWNGNELLGQSNADAFGDATISLNRALTEADSVVLAQEQSGHTSESIAVAPVRPIGEPPYDEMLPSPVVGKPLLECTNQVSVSNLLVGAQYEIYDEAVKVFGPGCGRPTPTTNRLGEKLQADHHVTATQRIPALNLESVSKPPVAVTATGRTPAPVIQSPLWERQQKVHVDWLLPGATIEIVIDGNTTRADSNTRGEFRVPELVAGQTIKARQALCGRWSDWSEAVVQGAPGPVTPPTIEPKHYPCAGLVRLREELPGEVQVYADQILIGTGEGRFIPVLPHLQAHQALTATRSVGAVTSTVSPPVNVSPAPEAIPAPSVFSADSRASCATL